MKMHDWESRLVVFYVSVYKVFKKCAVGAVGDSEIRFPILAEIFQHLNKQLRSCVGKSGYIICLRVRLLVSQPQMD